MTKKHKQIAIAAALIMITICAVFLLNKCSGGPPDNTLLSVASGEPWDNENVNGNGNSEESQGYISIPGYSKLYASKNQPNVPLVNPRKTRCIFNTPYMLAKN